MQGALEIMDWLDGRSRFFRASELDEAGLSRRALTSLVQSGRIAKVTHGIYCDREIADAPFSPMVALSMRVPGIVIAEASAAHLHFDSLTSDNNGRGVTALMERDRRVKDEDALGAPVSITRTANAKRLKVGIVETEVYGQKILVTSPERTIVDLLTCGYADIGMETLNRYADSSQAEPGCILRVAGRLDCRDQIEGYVAGVFSRRHLTPAVGGRHGREDFA